MRRFALILSLLASACAPLTPPQPQPRATLAGAAAALAPAAATTFKASALALAAQPAAAKQDRRPIARMDLATRQIALAMPDTNPNGWVVLPGPNFEAGILRLFRLSLAYAKENDCQGFWIHALEGQPYDEGAVGRPMNMGSPYGDRPPEMSDALVGTMVDEANAAGMYVIFTMRHTTARKSVTGRVQQADTGDPATATLRKLYDCLWTWDSRGTGKIGGVFLDTWCAPTHLTNPDGSVLGLPPEVCKAVTDELPNMRMFTECYAPGYENVKGVYPCRFPGQSRKPFPELVIPDPSKGGKLSAAEMMALTKDFRSGDIPCISAYPASWNGPTLAAYKASLGPPVTQPAGPDTRPAAPVPTTGSN